MPNAPVENRKEKADEERLNRLQLANSIAVALSALGIESVVIQPSQDTAFPA
jgi:hypothetical protein